MIKVCLVLFGVVVINFFTILILFGCYMLINSFIEEITGDSISDRIQDYLISNKSKNRRK